MPTIELTLIEFLQGLFSFIIVITAALTGILIALRYFQTKQWTFLTIGLAWIGVVAGWIPDSINFILVFFGQRLPLTIYLIIAIALYPPVVLLWLTGITKLLEIKKRKQYLILFLIFCIISEIIFFIFLIIDKTGLVGEFISIFIVDFKLYSMIILFLSLVLIIFSGLKFAYGAFTSTEPKIKLKGNFLLFAFISVTIGVLLDLITTALSGAIEAILYVLLPIMIVIARLIIAISCIAFYCGYILPKWLEDLFLKASEK